MTDTEVPALKCPWGSGTHPISSSGPAPVMMGTPKYLCCSPCLGHGTASHPAGIPPRSKVHAQYHPVQTALQEGASASLTLPDLVSASLIWRLVICSWLVTPGISLPFFLKNPNKRNSFPVLANQTWFANVAPALTWFSLRMLLPAPCFSALPRAHGQPLNPSCWAWGIGSCDHSFLPYSRSTCAQGIHSLTQSDRGYQDGSEGN